MDTSDDLVRYGLEQLDVELAILDGEGVIVYTNEAWKRYAVDGGFPGDPAMLGESYFDAVRKARDSDEYAQKVCERLTAILGGETDHFEFEYPCPDPEDPSQWYYMQVSRFEYGGELYLLVAHLNITERKRAERRALHRNETLAGVASILSHDLKSPMSAAMAWGEVIERDPNPENVERMLSALKRMDSMIDGAVVLARDATVEEVGVLDVGNTARRAWELLDTKEAHLDIAPVEPVVGNEGLVQTLFENLFKNALEHAGTDVTVSVGPLESTDMTTGFFVEDDGPGIPETERDDVFESGFSQHSTPENVGIGLSIVKGAVNAHDWGIELIESDSGGVRFEISGVRRADSSTES